jgi:hypothetical protein
MIEQRERTAGAQDQPQDSPYAQPSWILGAERTVAGRTVRHGQWSSERRLFRFWHKLACAHCGHVWWVEADSYHEFAGKGCPQCQDMRWRLTAHGRVEEGR